MSNLQETIPIDDWGVKHAPKLVENIDTHLAVMADELCDETRYTIRRLVMMNVRQWAQDKLKEINTHGQEPCETDGGRQAQEACRQPPADAGTFIPED